MANRTSTIKSFSAVITVMTLLSCLLNSCDKEIKFRGDFSGEKLVMYCMASTDLDTLSVMLKKSKFFLDDSDEPTWAAMAGATVTGDINGKIIEFKESTKTPGTYEYAYTVKEGDIISIKASKNGFNDASAKAIVPKKPSFEVKSIKIIDDPEFIFSKDLQVRVTIHDDGNEDNFYRVVPMEVSWNYDDEYTYWRQAIARTGDILFLNTGSDFFGDIEDAVNGDTGRTYIDLPVDDGIFNGKDYTFEYTVSVYDYDDGYYGGDGSVQYDKDGNWEVDLSRHKLMIECISADLYKYELSKESYHYDDMGFFSEPVAIHNNIKGGIGCFGATSSHTIRFDEL